jgi:hypothetical protein
MDHGQVTGKLYHLRLLVTRIFDAINDRSVVLSGTPVSSTDKTERHDTTEILLKVVLNTINLNLISKIRMN